jgi:hypothetical protein
MPESRADAVAQVIAHVGFKGEIVRAGRWGGEEEGGEKEG